MSKYMRITISVTDEDKKRLIELKSILNQKTYSKVIQTLIKHGKL